MNPTVKRTIFGVLFLAVMLGGLLFNRILFTILFSLISFIMLSEFYRMTMADSYRSLQDFSAAMGAALVWLTGYSVFKGESLAEAFLPGLLIFTGAIMIWSIFLKDHKDFLKTGYLYAGLLYIGLPVALSNVVVYNNGEFSGLLMIAFFIIIWASDTGAYCFGMLFGKKIWIRIGIRLLKIDIRHADTIAKKTDGLVKIRLGYGPKFSPCLRKIEEHLCGTEER